MSEVLSYFIDYLEDDEIFCWMIDEIRYFGFIDIDREKNLYCYDF